MAVDMELDKLLSSMMNICCIICRYEHVLTFQAKDVSYESSLIFKKKLNLLFA